MLSYLINYYNALLVEVLVVIAVKNVHRKSTISLIQCTKKH